MNSKVIVALDYETEAQALSLVDQIDPSLCRLKVGKEMFTTLGTSFVKQLHERQFDVFLDLKFHDIPNTVARAVRSAAARRFKLLTAVRSFSPLANMPSRAAKTLRKSIFRRI